MDSEARFVLSRTGRLEYANRAAKALLDEGRVGVGVNKHLRFGEARSDENLTSGFKEGGVRPSRFVAQLRDGSDCPAELRFFEDADVAVLSIYNTSMMAISEILEPVGRRFDLTPSEMATLTGICDNLSPKHIARQRNLSDHTVRAHLRSIYGKLRVDGVTAAVITALRLAR